MKVNVEALLERLGIRADPRGAKLWAPCPHPEHHDTEPSWWILDDPDDDRHGLHRCYGCGWGGYPVQLVEAVKMCDRSQAWEWLHAHAKGEQQLPSHVEVMEQGGGIGTRLCRMPPEVVVDQVLMFWPDAFMEYMNQRGVTSEQVADWEIGYADEGRLRGRVVFPVRDTRGALAAWAARSIRPNAQRRYLESSVKDGTRTDVLYGEHRWGEDDRVVVTEGMFDALAVERVTDGAVAALRGSQAAEVKLGKLAAFDWVFVATDNDAAGNRVAKLIEQGLARWCKVRRVQLPEGEDCDSMDQDRLLAALTAAGW